MARSRAPAFALAALAALAGCDDPDNPPAGASPPDAGAPEALSGPWRVHVAEGAPEAVHIAAEETAALLGQMGKAPAVLALDAEIPCAPGALDVIFDPDPVPGSDQAWAIDEVMCEGGRRITLSGGGRLGQQYAAYAWLHDLGVRFFHPEQIYVPEAPAWGEAPIQRAHTPGFQYRSVSLHLTHPLELGDPIRGDRLEYLDEVGRYIDWQVRNFASDGLGSKAGTALADYGHMRGFPQAAGVHLRAAQQGGNACLDPADPRPMEEKLIECVEAQMAAVPEADTFSLTFNESEFPQTTGDIDLWIVDALTFIADYMAAEHPGVDLYATYHGTHTPLTDNYALPFFELPRLAPDNLGVKIHTLMFYDLERPAPVYGNADFSHMLDFMEAEAATRRLWHFPEAAWWLTFDIAVPLYLPVTIEARSHDLDLIEPLRSEDPTGPGVVGHRVFGTGHEWGYWQNEYCSLRMAADPAYRWRDCLSDITGIFGEAAAEAQATLEAMIAAQIRDFIYDAELLGYMVGTDPETEAAFAAGIVFHPLPPAPGEILRWDAEQIDRWLGAEGAPGEDLGIAARLWRIAEEQAAWAERLKAVADQVPAAARPWFDEIVDGVEINGLRARHQHDAYGALVLTRLGRLTGDAEIEAEGLALLDAAEATTEAALAVIRRRSEGYRYAPLERAVGGGEALDGDDNWTVYDYRYLARTHHAYYYRRVDVLAREAIEAPADGPLEIADALLSPGQALSARITDAALIEQPVAFGDGEASVGALEITHGYTDPGLYTLTLGPEADPIYSARIAQSAEAWRTPYDEGFGAQVIDPAGVNAFIRNVLPGVVIGDLDAEAVALGFTLGPEGAVPPAWLIPSVRGESMRGEGALAVGDQLVVPVVSRGAALAGLALYDYAFVEGEAEGAPILTVTGALDKDQVVLAVGVVSNGALEEDDVRRLLPPLVGYPDYDAVPQRVPVEIRWPGLVPR